jgi:hypothetical protein
MESHVYFLLQTFDCLIAIILNWVVDQGFEQEFIILGVFKDLEIVQQIGKVWDLSSF